MITTIRRLCNLILFFLVYICTNSQDLRSFNQNASRSNHTRLSLTISPVFSSATNHNKDSLLFRGTGTGLQLGGDYFFGATGIGFSSGFNSSGADDASINNFLRNSGVPQDQLQVTKAKQQNMYLLLGPSVRFGNKVELYAHAKAGVFINNAGLISIQQRGAARAAYRNESTDKNMYPGFLTGLSVQYKTKSETWSFGLGADYMNTRSEVNNYDARRGNGIEPLKLSGSIRDVVAGISVRYNIFSPRDHASGQSTGRVLPTVNKREMTMPRDAASGLSTGKTYQPGRPVYGNITDREENNASCGPVTQKITNPDGSIQEMTFSCPADALAYARQTQKRDFGERVNQGNVSHEVKNAFVMPPIMESNGIISGTLTWASAGGGIVSNAVISGSSPRSGSTTMNSQSSSTRTTNQSSFGTMVRLSAREAGSGMATGRTAREASSGMASGRSLYQPVFADVQGGVCNPCLVTAKLSSVKNNPLYKEKGTQGTNPLYENKRTMAVNEECNGVAGADILLIDVARGEVVAKTKTEQCGDFFFANVPSGNYAVRVSALFEGSKGYDVHMDSKTDLAGTISQADDWMQLTINSNTGSNQQKAGISTSRSNIRQKSISIIEADLDGDGEFESLRATGTFSDGISADITSAAKTSNNGINLDASALSLRRRVEVLKSNKQGDPNAKTISGIRIMNTANNLRATATFSDGSTQDVSDAITANTSNASVKQYTIVVADLDGDGEPESVIKTKTKSNQSNDRVMASDPDDNGIWSPRSNIKLIRVAVGDIDGDGVVDLAAGNLKTEFAVLRDRKRHYFETGDVPSQDAMRPGNPIGGLNIKGGKNPGGNLRTVQTNENGGFEFSNLEPGDYTFTIDQRLILEDETLVSVGDDAVENIVTSESNLKGLAAKNTDVKVTASQNGQSLRAQNNNTVRSNRSELKSVIIEADLDGDGEYESDITNRISDEITIDGDGNIDQAPQQKAGVSTSRSNIRSRSTLVDKGDGLFVSYGRTNVNSKDVAVRIVYKASHDIQMNAIRNLK